MVGLVEPEQERLLADADTAVETAAAAVGTQAAINNVLAASGNVQYRPVADYFGSDTLTMTSIDNGANGTDPGLSGTATNEQDQDTVAITVTPVNDAPRFSSAGSKLVISYPAQTTLPLDKIGRAHV